MASEEAEDWEWVQSPPYHRESVHDEDEDAVFDKDAGTSVPSSLGTHFLEAPQCESISSTASSPILKHNVFATVMAKERISAISSLHHSVPEWLEPQLVYSKPHGLHFEGFEVYNAVSYLQNQPKAKEALLSLLSDPVVWDAVMSNKAVQELAFECTDIDQGLEAMKSSTAHSSSLISKHGKHAYKLLKEKLLTAVDVLLCVLGRRSFEKSVVDELDVIVKSCIVLVAILVFLMISKRSNEGLWLV